MKRLSLYIVLVLVGLIFIGVTEAAAQKKMKKEAVIWPAGDIKWEQLKGGPTGVMIANLWGNYEKGAYGALIKFPPNFKSPLHTHSFDLHAVIVSGTFLFTPEGGTEKQLGPGSYLFQPNTVKHVSAAGNQGCTFLCEQPSKFDLKPVEPPKKKN
jgi:quercetin dioxygenase-like cupin family protein